MLAEKKRNTNIGVAIGFLLQFGGQYLRANVDGMGIIGLVIAIIGLAFFIWGCVNYAQGKGYSSALGLLGLLSCFGLIVLVVLPDKRK
jgi:hypothetical protein